MLSFENSLSNVVDDANLSGLLLDLATSHAALGGSWFSDFHHGIAPAGNSLLTYINRF